MVSGMVTSVNRRLRECVHFVCFGESIPSNVHVDADSGHVCSTAQQKSMKVPGPCW